jgi:hypothetical protein
MPALLAIFGFGKSILNACLSWLSRQSPATLLCIALGVLLAIDHGALLMAHRHGAKVEAQLGKCTAGRAADRQAYTKAQADAAAQNKAQVAKVEQQYQRNSDDERQAYLSDLAKLRADRVRQQASAAPGSTSPANPPQAPAPAAGADGTRLCVPAESALCEAGAEIELRLMHLQNLYDQQTKVDPNTEAAPK